MPSNRQLNINSDYRVQLFEFFTMYAQSDQESMLLRKEYCYYITQHAPFNALQYAACERNHEPFYTLKANF